MKWVVICSPVSGTGKGKEVVEAELCPALTAKGVEYEVIYTDYKAHAVDLAKESAQRSELGSVFESRDILSKVYHTMCVRAVYCGDGFPQAR